MLFCTNERYPVTFDHWVIHHITENCRVPGKYILVHASQINYHDVMYIFASGIYQYE
jgi:hypothetical protein